MGRVHDWDIEAYDRLCHKQDRAYTLPGWIIGKMALFIMNISLELFDFIETAGLEFVTLTNPKINSILTIDDPVNFGKLDVNLKNNLKKLSLKEQMTVADLVDGTVHIHEFYARKTQEKIKQ